MLAGDQRQERISAIKLAAGLRLHGVEAEAATSVETWGDDAARRGVIASGFLPVTQDSYSRDL